MQMVLQLGKLGLIKWGKHSVDALVAHGINYGLDPDPQPRD